MRFNDRRGEFVKDDLYVFIAGPNMETGPLRGDGDEPALSDTDAVGLRDAAGNALVAEMIAGLQKADLSEQLRVAQPRDQCVVGEQARSNAQGGNSLVGVGHYLGESLRLPRDGCLVHPEQEPRLASRAFLCAPGDFRGAVAHAVRSEDLRQLARALQLGEIAPDKRLLRAAWSVLTQPS